MSLCVSACVRMSVFVSVLENESVCQCLCPYVGVCVSVRE